MKFNSDHLRLAIVVGVAVVTVAAIVSGKANVVIHTGSDTDWDEDDASAEAALWKERRDQALADIHAGMLIDEGMRIGRGFTSKEREAIELKHRVNQAYYKRCERTMSRVEQDIVYFCQRTW